MEQWELKKFEWEKAVVFLLNLDGWELEHCGDGYSRYDAKGKTPKGMDCVIEMKFRNKYYEDKMLEKEKYDALISLQHLKPLEHHTCLFQAFYLHSTCYEISSL